MSSRNLYTRRMLRAELDIWLELSGEVTPLERELAIRFAQLEDSIFFLSSIEDEIVGGTSIYRDRTRLAVALIAVNHRPDLKEPAQLQLLKSSLPFFRSVAIHHVDAVVETSGMTPELPFPAGFAMDNRFHPLLESLGFILEDNILRYTIELSGDHPKGNGMIEWKTSKDFEAIRDLFWRQNKTTGIDSSLVTLGWHMASAKNTLHTLEDDKGITAAIGLATIQGSAVIWPLIADFRLIDTDTLELAIYQRVLQTGASRMVFPILGMRQKDIMDGIADLCSGEVATSEALLLRRQL